LRKTVEGLTVVVQSQRVLVQSQIDRASIQEEIENEKIAKLEKKVAK
jgi:hypothetical protein